MEIKHILIIDDSKAEQIYLSEMLLFEGFVPIVASSADEAQKSLESYRPDLILMDVVMPGKSGFQYTRTLSNDPQFKDIPIILCTSKDQPTDRMWGLRQGARDYLVKPVQKADLIAKINAIASAN
jgi:twitching motility two-component system response regulator PilH